MPTVVGGVGGNDDDVPDARRYLDLASRTEIRLSGLVRLDRLDDLGVGCRRIGVGLRWHEARGYRSGSSTRSTRSLPRVRSCDVTSFLSIRDDGPVRTITMSNPGVKNAVPEDGWGQLAAAFDAFDDADVRVLVLTGADGEFCAGADLQRERPDVPSAAVNAQRMGATVNRAALALHRVNKPTIAAVDGVAVGAGMNLALGCDMLIATDRARFSEIFARRGLTLDFGGTWLLPRLVGLQRARELALTGRIVHAEEALRIGLATEVVAPDALIERAIAVAVELAAGAPLAQTFIKRGLDRSSAMTFEQALAFEEYAQGLLLASDDVREGARAFIEKRSPRFGGS